MKQLLLISFILFNPVNLLSQNLSNKNEPKLVIGIVIDQMRYDYLTRFWNHFKEDGFRRLVTDGFNFKNHHFNYIPTKTGPGHASVWTGTTPSNHGIIGNSWYDKEKDKMVYCTDDNSIKSVGTSADAGKMSPNLMKTTSVADQNRLHTQMKGKTIGIALKDRGSILPAGHTANAAYWFLGGEEGKFITSSYYRKNLPDWVKEFNNSGQTQSYLKIWEPLYDIESYVESGTDENSFEGGFKGKDKAIFPYNLKELSKYNNGFDIILNTPFGNDLTLEFAIKAIKAEDLGKDGFTDFLTLSFSSTDKVGHNFGVNSKEVQDTYLRLDKNISKFLKFLDKEIGKGQYTIFLTADHGAIHVPKFLESEKIVGGYFSMDKLKKELLSHVNKVYETDGLIANLSNYQVFFDYKKINEEKIDIETLEKFVAHYLIQNTHIDRVITRSQITAASYTRGIVGALQSGFNQSRSGDVIFVLNPSTISYKKTGSTHGSGLNYDTHIPLIFYGAGIKKGSTTQRSEIPDIAPTISSLLGMAFPNGATGKPLFQMLDE